MAIDRNARPVILLADADLSTPGPQIALNTGLRTRSASAAERNFSV